MHSLARTPDRVNEEKIEARFDKGVSQTGRGSQRTGKIDIKKS